MTFEDYVKQPEQKINVVEAALLFAKEEYPDMNVSSYLEKIETITKGAEKELGKYSTLNEAVEKLGSYIFTKLGFKGNNQNYYDPRNSYLNEVIDRRFGIPITLSILYAEVGLGLGLPLVGVNFPAHFLVKCVTPEYDLIIDCFNDGKILSINDCKKLLSEMAGPNAEFHTNMLEPAKPKDVLIRMLQNLKNAYMRIHEFSKAVRIVELINLVKPNHPQSFKDKAEIFIASQDFVSALKMLEQYIASPISEKEREAAQVELTFVKRALITLN